MTTLEITDDLPCLMRYKLEHMDDNDRLYFGTTWENAIMFKKVYDIGYCPVCGKKLKNKVKI